MIHMIISSPHTGKKPRISPDAFVAPNATIIGDVTIEAGANIWYGAVLRGDVCEIRVGKNTSIQDNCVLHSEVGTKCIVGDNCIVGHMAMIHGPCEIGDFTMIGLKSTVLQNTTVGRGALLAGGAVARKVVKDNCLYVGIPASFKKELGDKHIDHVKSNALFYADNGKKFREAGFNHPNIEEFLVETP